LRLQDKAGIDVIALIAVLYADAVLTRSCDEQDIAKLQALMSRWRDETVLPLRRLRRALKQPPQEFPAEETEALRGLIKKAELRAEQIQLALAEQWLSERPPHAGRELEQMLTLLLTSVPARNDEIAGMFARTVAEARATARG
jgi:uncharacterized protein (TIGR02444 family)